MPFDLPPLPSSTPRILVIDADASVADKLRGAFAGNDFQFEQVRSPAVARSLIAAAAIDLIILDLDLPGGNGLDLLRSVRALTSAALIVVTARAQKLAPVLCLELGADDYVAKPADFDELNARIRAVLRRREGDQTPGFGERRQTFGSGIVEFAGWRFDTAGLSLWSARGDLVDLTATEAAVLRFLVHNAKRPLGRAAINAHVHGEDSGYDDRSVDVLIKKLRAKLAAHDAGFQPVRSIRGVGYMFSPDVRAAD